MSDLQQGIVPHLVVDDAAAAIKFYKAALSATEAARMPAKDGKRLMHAPLEVNGAKLLLGDDFPVKSLIKGWIADNVERRGPAADCPVARRYGRGTALRSQGIQGR